MRLITLVITFLVSLATAYAQQVANVSFYQDGGKVVVQYDLIAEANKSHEVSIFYSLDGGKTFQQPKTAMTGSVGKGIKAGKSLQAVWNVLAETDRLQSNAVVFKVVADGGPKSETFEKTDGEPKDETFEKPKKRIFTVKRIW